MPNRFIAGFVMVLGAVWCGSSFVHGYILGVVADRPESDGAFQGAEQATLTVIEAIGVVGGLVLLAIGLISVIWPRNTQGSVAKIGGSQR